MSVRYGFPIHSICLYVYVCRPYICLFLNLCFHLSTDLCLLPYHYRTTSPSLYPYHFPPHLCLLPIPVSLCISASLCICLPISVSPSLSPYLCFHPYLCLPISVSRSICVSLYLCLPILVFIAQSPHICLPLYLCLHISVSFSISVSLPISISLSQFPSLSLSPYLCQPI